MKEGRKTTEWKATLILGAATLAGTLQGSLPPEYAVKVGAAITAVYTLARTVQKVAHALGIREVDAFAGQVIGALDSVKATPTGVEVTATLTPEGAAVIPRSSEPTPPSVLTPQ